MVLVIAKINWKQRARIAKILDKMPRNLANWIYYLAQRFGGGITPAKLQFENSAVIAKTIRQQHKEVLGKTFLEIGTGRTFNVPMGLWLCGAGKIITVDVNPYLRKEQISNSVDLLARDGKMVNRIFSDFIGETVFQERFNIMLRYKNHFSELINATNIEYISKGNATALDLPDNSVDYFFSNYVLEHIPPDIIGSILLEARRVMRKDGLLIHIIDPSDHFAHHDYSISSINFLQYGEEEWHNIAGNRFFYLNRLRAYEYYELFERYGIKILHTVELLDEKAVGLLQKGFPLDSRFSGHTPEELAVCEVVPLVGEFI